MKHTRFRHLVCVHAHERDYLLKQRFLKEFGGVHSCRLDMGPVTHDTSVLCVLYGKDTHQNRSIKWHLACALSREQSGLCGIMIFLLPDFPTKYGVPIKRYLHPSAYRTIQMGYADLYFWPPRNQQNLVGMDLAADEAVRKKETMRPSIDHMLPSVQIF